MGIDKDDYTTEDFRVLPVEELYNILASCQSPGYYEMAVEELQRRFLKDIGSQTQSLTESSQRVEAIANNLNGSVTALDASVQKLADSSLKMERLTKAIIWLTILLLALTMVQVFMLFREKPAGSTAPAIKEAVPTTPSPSKEAPAAGSPTVVKPPISAVPSSRQK